LNQQLTDHAVRRLEHLKDDLEDHQHGWRLERLVEHDVIRPFEAHVKSGFDFERKDKHDFSIRRSGGGYYTLKVTRYAFTVIHPCRTWMVNDKFRDQFLDDVFKPVYSDILLLLKEQIREMPHSKRLTIVPFGGGMKQPYLKTYLESELRDYELIFIEGSEEIGCVHFLLRFVLRAYTLTELI